MTIATGCALLAAALASAPESMTAYDTIKVAEGIYAFVPPESSNALVSGNSIAVLGDEGVLVVDTGHYPSATRRMIAQIRGLTDKPVRIVVNTHWHSDHVTGNSIYKDAFPDVTIVSTAATRREYADGLAKSDAAAMKASIKSVRVALQTGKRSSGKPLTEEEKTFYAGAIKEVEEALPDLEQARSLPPAMTFDDEVRFYLGKREVRVLFLGRGNTAGDAVVYVPDAKVLMTGDLMVMPTPYAFGSFMTEWIATLKKLAAIDATSIVPGHGPVQHDKAFLTLLTSLLESVTAQVTSAARTGLSLEDTRKKLDVEKLRNQFTGESASRSKAFHDYFLEPGVARAYREAKEGPLKDEN